MSGGSSNIAVSEEHSADSPVDLVARAESAGQWLAVRDYHGWDPYDGLQTPLAQLPMLRDRHKARFVFQQIVKRSPINLRRLLRIPPGRNPVTLALAAQAHAYLACLRRATSDGHRAAAHRLVEEVARTRSAGWTGSCWGYDFDWEARRVTIPAGFPTLVATGMVTNSLFEVDRLLDDPTARTLVIDALPFVTDDLHRTADSDGAFCWSYSPRDEQVVLNATMKGARLCAQVSQLTGDPGVLSLSQSTVAFVVRRQRDDGSWPYAEGDERSWADNFHTGYVLECLKACREAGVKAATADAIERGLAFYRENFFSAAGAPLYYPNRRWPIDATACAQSILTLCRFSDFQLARRVAAWTMEHMSNPDGSFAYRLEKRRVDRTPFARWSVAWMFCALARLATE